MFTAPQLAKAFVSPEHGWNISLPSGWKALAKVPFEVSSGLSDVEVFAHTQDPSLSMTWMRSRNKTSAHVLQRFNQMTTTIGGIPPAEVQELMMQIFPLMGRTASAFAVSLPEGLRALELTEEIHSIACSNESMRGYHLVLPVRNDDSSTALPASMYMQQLVFYARASKFAQEIVQIIQSARSFKHL